MIEDIIIFPNGMVAVCDEKGQQIRSLQGRWSQKKDILLYLINKYPSIKVMGNINQKKPQWEIEKYG